MGHSWGIRTKEQVHFALTWLLSAIHTPYNHLCINESRLVSDEISFSAPVVKRRALKTALLRGLFLSGSRRSPPIRLVVKPARCSCSFQTRTAPLTTRGERIWKRQWSTAMAGFNRSCCNVSGTKPVTPLSKLCQQVIFCFCIMACLSLLLIMSSCAEKHTSH